MKFSEAYITGGELKSAGEKKKWDLNKDWGLSRAKQNLWQALRQYKKSAQTTQNVNVNIHSGTLAALRRLKSHKTLP